MATLTAFGTDQGFTAGDLDASGYVAAVAAYQTIYVADGRPYTTDINTTGYHKIDFVNTKITGALTGTISVGDSVTQENTTAAGVVMEILDATHYLIYRTTTIQFNSTDKIELDDSNYITPSAAPASPPHWLAWVLKGSIPSSFIYTGTADSGGTTTLIDATLTGTYAVDDYVNDWYCYITSGTGKGSYAQITDYEAATGTITVADWLKADGTAGGVDPDGTSIFGLALDPPSTGGTFPDGGSNIMCLFEGRIWLNSMWNPNQWFATRQGNPLDLDTSIENDVQAAISSQSSEAGKVGDAVVGLIPYKDNYLIFGLANSFYILRGGSTGSGALSNFITETGLFGPDSWCWDDAGNLYVVGLTGFFKIPVGAASGGTTIDNISFRKLPQLFKDMALNRQTDRVVLGYDRDNNTVHVAISMQDGTWNVCFVYDAANDAILPDSYTSGQVPSSFLYMNNYQGAVSGLLVGEYDGYIRQFDPTQKTDDGTEITSFVLFGPITINDLLRANVKIKELQIILSENTDGMIWELYEANSSELIVKGLKDSTLVPTHAGVIEGGGRQFSIQEKIAGESVAVLFRNNTGLETPGTWEIEGVKVKYTISGRAKD